MSGKLIHNLKRKREDEPDEPETSNLNINKKTKNDNKPKEDQTPKPIATVPKEDFLKDAMEKILQLQNEILSLDSDSGEESADEYQDEELKQQVAFESEALGFAMCARETLTFLCNEGLSPDSPLVVTLRERLVGMCSEIPI